MGPEGIELLMGMLILDPNRRITAEECLRHGYWAAEPKPSRTEDLPKKQKGSEKKLVDDLKRRPGQLGDRGASVARKLDFTAMR